MEPQPVSPAEARTALDAVRRERRRVLDEVGLPAWYWWGLAVGWIVLGVIADLEHPWLTSAATLVFGAVHSTVAPRVVSGRNRTSQLSVRRELAGRHTAALVLGGLVALAGVTVVAALLLDADGARDPATIASVFVAVLILLGGPQLLLRSRAAG
jgi:hypothetical protein